MLIRGNNKFRIFLYRSLLMTFMMLLVISSQAEAQLSTQKQTGWQSEVSLYYWFPETDGLLTIDGLSARYDLSSKDLAELTSSLEAAFMGMINLRNGPWLFYLNTVYVHYDDVNIEGIQVGPAQADVDIEWEQMVTEAAIGYRVAYWGESKKGNPGVGVDLLLGARYVDIDAKVEVTDFPDPAFVGLESAGREKWLEPWIGIRSEVLFADNWSLYGQAGIGGFGVNNVPSTSIDVIGAIRYQLTQHWAANLAYRHLELDYKKGNVVNIAGEVAPSFAHNSNLTGPIVGLTYVF